MKLLSILIAIAVLHANHVCTYAAPQPPVFANDWFGSYKGVVSDHQCINSWVTARWMLCFG